MADDYAPLIGSAREKFKYFEAAALLAYAQGLDLRRFGFDALTKREYDAKLLSLATQHVDNESVFVRELQGAIEKLFEATREAWIGVFTEGFIAPFENLEQEYKEKVDKRRVPRKSWLKLLGYGAPLAVAKESRPVGYYSAIVNSCGAELEQQDIHKPSEILESDWKKAFELYTDISDRLSRVFADMRKSIKEAEDEERKAITFANSKGSIVISIAALISSLGSLAIAGYNLLSPKSPPNLAVTQSYVVSGSSGRSTANEKTNCEDRSGGKPKQPDQQTVKPVKQPLVPKKKKTLDVSKAPTKSPTECLDDQKAQSKEQEPSR